MPGILTWCHGAMAAAVHVVVVVIVVVVIYICGKAGFMQLLPELIFEIALVPVPILFVEIKVG